VLAGRQGHDVELARCQGQGALIDHAPDGGQQLISQLGERAADDDAVRVIEVHQRGQHLSDVLSGLPDCPERAGVAGLRQLDHIAGVLGLHPLRL
jgi:hypothetical protein